VPAERRQCEGDACQGALTNPAPLLVSGSVSQTPGENFSLPKTHTHVKKTTKKPTKKKQKPPRKKAKRVQARGRTAIRGWGRR